MNTASIQHLVIDAANPQLVANFWSQALERPIEDDWGDFVRLEADDAGTRIAFATVPEPKLAKNRLHLDITTGNRESAVAELIALGGSVVGTRTSGDHTWTVMCDPEGNEFCVA